MQPLQYERADSVAAAIELLAVPESKVIAGGQSLVPMMSMGLAAPDRVVDIGRLELAGLETRADVVRVGALTRHRELERSAQASELLPLAAEAAAHVGNPRVRNRGTFGGSLSHADPAAELCAAALAYGGEVVIEGPGGERRVALDDFFGGWFETALEDGELLVAVELERPAPGSGTAFSEMAQRADDFAVAAAAAVLTPNDDHSACSRARVVVAGVGGAATRLTGVEQICNEALGSDERFHRIAEEVRSAIEPEDDPFVSAAYRRDVAAACVERAVRTAWRRAG